MHNNIFLVQTEEHGPQRPIHVVYGEDDTGSVTAECTNNGCKEINQALRRSDQTVKLCKHIKSLQNNANEICIAFTEVNKGSISDLKQFSAKHKQDVVLPLMEQARQAGHRLAVPFNTGGIYWYFSVYDDDANAHWYSHHNRLVVSYNTTTGHYVCSCKKLKFCKHVAAAMAAMSSVTDGYKNQKLPLQDLNISDCENTESDKTKDEMLRYLTKKDVMEGYSEKLPEEGDILTPSETRCFACDNFLIDGDDEQKVQVLDPLVSGLEVILKTKKCKSCDMTFEYNETRDGVFRFRRKLYSNSLMNRCHVALTTSKQSFEAHVDYLNEVYKRNFDYKSLMSAFFSFAGYYIAHCLGSKTTFSCNQCGYYPRTLIADVQRCMNFSTRFQKIGKGSNYLKMDDFIASINRPGVAEALFGTKCTKMDLCEQLPVIGSCNLLDQPPPYLRQIKSCPRPEKAVFPEVFLDRLEGYCKEEPWKLDTLLKELGLAVKGSKDDKIEAILSSGKFDLFQKVFPKVYGKSGGLLRFVCPHGLTYLTKFLVRAEGSTDYAEVLMSLVYPPTLFVCDFVAEVIASVLKHQPDFFPPFGGFVGDPTDGRLLELLNNKKSLENSQVSIPCLDPGFVQASNTLVMGEHPVSGSSSRYGCIDRWHERCHKKTPVRCLLSLNSIKETSYLNSEAAEQQNFSISTIKRHTKKLRTDRHMKLVLLTLIKQNGRKNETYLTKLEKQTNVKFNVDPNFGWLVPVDSPGRPFPNFVTPNTTKDRLVIPEVLVHPGHQTAVGSSVFMVSLPDVDYLDQFNLAISIFFYCGLDAYFTKENSSIPLEFLQLKEMLRGKYSPKVHTGAGRKFWEVTGLSSTATVKDCLRQLIKLIQLSEGCPEISDQASSKSTSDWLMSTTCNPRTQSFHKLHCFAAKKQIFANVGNTFYCITSGVRIVIDKRIFNDWQYELDVGMFKREASHQSQSCNNQGVASLSTTPVQQPIKQSLKTAAGPQSPAQPCSNPFLDKTAKKRGSDVPEIKKLPEDTITSDEPLSDHVGKSDPNNQSHPKYTSKHKVWPKAEKRKSCDQDNCDIDTKPAVKTMKPDLITLDDSPVTISVPEEQANFCDAPFDQLLDDDSKPVRQLYPDKTTLMCCSTTTVFGIPVGQWMQKMLLTKSRLNGDIIDACCHNILFNSGSNNIKYLESLMVTDLMRKLDRRIVDASLLKQVQQIKFFQADMTLFVVNVNRNHWILTAIIPSRKMVVFLNPSKVGSSKSSVFPVFKLLQKIHLLECGSTMTQLDYRFHCPADLNGIQDIGDGTECGVICLVFVHVICFRCEFPKICDQHWLNNFRVYLFNSLIRCKQEKAFPKKVVALSNTYQERARRVEELQIILKDFHWSTVPLEAGGICSGRSTKVWLRNIIKILNYNKPSPLKMGIFDF